MLRTAAILTLSLICAVPALAQSPGPASFRVLERDQVIGTVSVSVTLADGGWHVESTSHIGGSINLDVRRMEIDYDQRWRTRFVTLEVARGGESRIIHAAVGGFRSQLDVVVPDKEARFGTHRVSPGTIALPDYVFGAYEGLAARLVDLPAGTEIPLLLTPRGEFSAGVDAVKDEQVVMKSGTITARRVSLLVYRDGATPIDVWIDRGRLLRIDLPEEGISVIRDDVGR